jgi:hypothetical protein
MQEVRVESLDGLEVRGSELRLSANAGRLRIVFPREVWEHVLASAEVSEEPEEAELEELYSLKERLGAHAREQAFETALEGIGVGEPGLEYDLVLRPSGLFADDEALLAGDENLKALSIRGRRCSTSRFEMAPELWRVLAEGLGWDNVETFVNDGGV